MTAGLPCMGLALVAAFAFGSRRVGPRGFREVLEADLAVLGVLAQELGHAIVAGCIGPQGGLDLKHMMLDSQSGGLEPNVDHTNRLPSA